MKKTILFTLLAVLITSCFFSVPDYKGEKSDHFDGEQFYNLDKPQDFNYLDLLKFFVFRTEGYWADYYPQEIEYNIRDYVGNGELEFTFVGHASTLIQFDSINVLTDPVWSDYTTPVKPIGPKRRREAGIDFDDLPPIDIVVISHNHYDHMDFATLEKLKDAHDPLILYPLGNKPLFDDYNLPNSDDMDWWEERVVKDRKVTFVPARHFANRGIADRNGTLWGGYVFESDGGPVYFAGDTGFGIHFTQIKDKFGPMRFSILPIAPILPRSFMQEVHQDAREAVLSHIELESQQSIGIHFGTFKQAADGMTSPIDSLIVGLKDNNVSPKEFFLPGHGRVVKVPPLKNYLSTQGVAK